LTILAYLIITFTAISRQQARHLGLYANWTEEDVSLYRNRRWDAGGEKPIRVGIHVLSVANELDLVYFVTADDRPVSAATAVRDMGLVTTQEVADRLGYAVKIKARREFVGILLQARPPLSGFPRKKRALIKINEFFLYQHRTMMTFCGSRFRLFSRYVSTTHNRKLDFNPTSIYNAVCVYL